MSDTSPAPSTPPTGEPPPAAPASTRVERTTPIHVVLDSRPDAGRVLREEFGLPCEECVVAEVETLEEGARYYGLDVEKLVRRLNECKQAPPPPEARP